MLKTIKVIKSSAGFKYFEIIYVRSIIFFFRCMVEISNNEDKKYVKMNMCVSMQIWSYKAFMDHIDQVIMYTLKNKY